MLTNDQHAITRLQRAFTGRSSEYARVRRSVARVTTHNLHPTHGSAAILTGLSKNVTVFSLTTVSGARRMLWNTPGFGVTGTVWG